MSRAPAGTCLSLIAATALALAGCGGGDSSTAEDSSTTSTTASTVAKPDAVQQCLTDAGLDVQADKPTNDHMLAVLYVSPDTFTQVYVAFMDSPEAAAQTKTALDGLAVQAGGNAGGEVADGTVVLGRARDTTQADVDQVKGCLTG